VFQKLSLSLLSKYLMGFCLVSMVLISMGAISLHALFDEIKDASEWQSSLSQKISVELNDRLLPINEDLSEIRMLLSEFSAEMSLLSLDPERDFARLERIQMELGNVRDNLSESWPVGLLETSLLERMTSNILISEDIAIEVLQLRNPNYTYQLHEESVEIIDQLVKDSELILNAVSEKLAGLAQESMDVARAGAVATEEAHGRLQRESILFVFFAVVLLFAIVFFIRAFSAETRRRLNLLKRYAQGVEEGSYDQVVDLDVNDASGQLARSLESMSNRLVELIRESEELAQKAGESSKAKSEFLAKMSHEIRTPMNGVIGLLDVLAPSKLDAQQRHYVQLAQSSANSLLNLINDILDFSKIESGKLALEDVEFDVLELMNDFVDVMSHTAREKGLALLFKPLSMDNGWIKGDPTRIRQVLTNLVGNALKFTHQGEINIYIDLRERGGRSWLYFEVTDQGIGIPEDSLNSLFESFTQVDASTTRKYGGTGLGLSITNQLVKLMGGDQLHVRSLVGEGSTFYFEIPAEQVRTPKDAEDEQFLPIESRIAAEAPQAKQHVLLVEDNAVNQVVAQTLIEAEGYEVEIANHGEEALELLRRHSDFVIVFMDCQMPVMDGYTTTAEIRKGEAGKAYKDITIIAMTANAMEGDRERCLNAGMDAYITKPIDAEILSKTLEDSVSQR
jgi:signal transduction histidine kinase/ActR/RegA family two-component response regulator